MPVIGNFIPGKDGGWIGAIRTLTIDAKLRFVPNDDRDSTTAPTFRVFVGQSRIGHAWVAHTGGDSPKTYFSVKLDDPNFAEPISAALFPTEEGDSAQLVWKRPKERNK
jgi:uncharacterized protein (DUF736 family)